MVAIARQLPAVVLRVFQAMWRRLLPRRRFVCRAATSTSTRIPHFLFLRKLDVGGERLVKHIFRINLSALCKPFFFFFFFHFLLSLPSSPFAPCYATVLDAFILLCAVAFASAKVGPVTSTKVKLIVCTGTDLIISERHFAGYTLVEIESTRYVDAVPKGRQRDWIGTMRETTTTRVSACEKERIRGGGHRLRQR